MDNYFKYNLTNDLVRFIDWYRYGSGGHAQDEQGNHYTFVTYSCGDNSMTYPMFEPIPLENKEEIVELINYIEMQLADGYIDLGLHDEKELQIVRVAIEEYKQHHI